MSETTTLLTTPPCHGHGDTATFSVPVSAVTAWWAGEFIQDAFPMLTADEREWLMSGYCPRCWDEMFPPEEDEDEYDVSDQLSMDDFGWANLPAALDAVLTADYEAAQECYADTEDSDLLDMADDYTYDSDWYVSESETDYDRLPGTEGSD